MSRPRPASAGVGHSRPLTCTVSPHGRLTKEHQLEQLLLRKIGILAEHHARNVGALRRLRRDVSPPKAAWASPTNRSPPYEATSHAKPSTGESPQEGYSKLICAQPANQAFATPSRTFTRVLTTSSSRRHKPVPTVVEPFRSMEIHTAAWKRKIGKCEELEFQTKKDEEEARINDRERFISAINAEGAFCGVIARSNEMVERRRKQQLEAEQHEEEDRQRHEFKARPLHIADEDWQTIQNRQTVRRKQRVQRRKEMMSSISHLPRRMAMHALKQKEAAAVTIGVGGRSTESESRTRGRSVPPERITLILSRKQQRWDEQLAAAKRVKKPVVPQVLPMEERDKLYRQRAQERARRKQSQSSLGCQRDKGNETLRTKSRTTFARAPVVVPRTTTNFQMKTAAIYARREKEVDDLERKKQLEKARRVQEQVTSKRLAQAMAQMDRQQGRMPRRDTVEEAHQNARESRERYRKALKENRKKLEQATRDAPTLWERHDAEMRKETAKRIALRQVAESVLEAGHGGWRGTTTAERMFDEEELAILSLPT